MSVYDDLCTFALAHGSCGETLVQVDPGAPRRYRVLLTCSCGAQLKRSVTQDDARADLGSAAGQLAQGPRRGRAGYGSPGSTPRRWLTA
jgi:hypothetical protein